MIKYKILYYGMTFVLMLFLIVSGMPPLLSGVLTVIIMVTVYLLWHYSKQKRRVALLEVAYDPQAFILATEAQRHLYKKSEDLVNHDIACGHMALGDYEGALEIFKNLNLKRFLKMDASRYAYYHNYCLCLFELGEIEAAEKIYEQKIAQIPVINKRQQLLLELLMGTYYYYKKDYQTARLIVEKFLENPKITPYLKLNALYTLACIEEIQGHLEVANNLYMRVAKHGGQLDIAKKSKKKLNSI